MRPGKLTVRLLDSGGAVASTSIWVPLEYEIDGRDGFISALAVLSDAVVVSWAYSYGMDIPGVVGAGDVREGGILYYDNAVDVTAVAVPAMADEFFFHQSGHKYDGVLIDKEPVVLSYLSNGGFIVADNGDAIGQFVVGVRLK